MYTADMLSPVYLILPSISSSYSIHLPQISLIMINLLENGEITRRRKER